MGRLADALVARRRVVLAAAAAVTVAAVALLAVGLRFAEKPPMLLRPDSNLQRVQTLFNEKFELEGETVVELVWGVRGVEWGTAATTELIVTGKPEWDTTFDLALETSQQHVRETCAALWERHELLHVRSGHCFMEKFAGWCAQEGLPFPVPAANFSAVLGRWVSETHSRADIGWTGGTPGAGAVRYASASWRVDLMPLAVPTGELRRVYASWDAFVADLNGYAGAERARTYHTSGLWDRLGLEIAVDRTVRVAPLTSAAAAVLAVLVTTRSFTVAVCASATVALSTLLLLAGVVLAGWELGVIEGLCVALLIGSSVDYCIHFAVAFGDTPGDRPREARVREALRVIGPTVVVAALTTASASSLLMFCEVVVFVKIGAVLCLNTLAGATNSLVVFPALLACVGPGAPERIR